MTTGNSDMAANTGNSYTAGSTTLTDSVEIPTASPVFLTTASPNKVSQVITTMSDNNRKWYNAVKTGNTYISNHDR